MQCWQVIKAQKEITFFQHLMISIIVLLRGLCGRDEHILLLTFLGGGGVVLLENNAQGGSEACDDNDGPCAVCLWAVVPYGSMQIA